MLRLAATPALALVALVADLNFGPECVRMWTRALDPSYPSSLDPPLREGGGPMFSRTLADMRQLRGERQHRWHIPKEASQ
jgi:hypothetical protein